MSARAEHSCTDYIYCICVNKEPEILQPPSECWEWAQLSVSRRARLCSQILMKVIAVLQTTGRYLFVTITMASCYLAQHENVQQSAA